MIYPSEADIIPFLKCLTQGLQPYALSNDVSIGFSSTIKKQVLQYQPFLLSQSVVQLVCNIINLLPPKSKIILRLLYSAGNQHLQVEVENDSINLIRVNEICTQGIYTFTGYSLTNGTIYRLLIALQLNVNTETNKPAQATASGNNVPQFYKEVQNVSARILHKQKN